MEENNLFMYLRVVISRLIFLAILVALTQDIFAQNQILWRSPEFIQLNSLSVSQQKMEAEKQITVLKNSKDLLPFGVLDKKFVILTVGEGYQEFTKTIELFTDFTEININFFEEIEDDKLKLIRHADHFILSIHISDSQRYNEQALNYLQKIRCQGMRTVVLFVPSNVLRDFKIPPHDALIMSYENHPFILDRTAQVLFGAIPAQGKLKNDLTKFHTEGDGLDLRWGGRLKFTDPEEVGIDSKKLEEIDNIAQKGISSGAYPGCQIVAAVDGKIFYRKTFGNQRYEKSSPVRIDDIYDLASITKIGASTTGLMFLESNGKFDVSKRLNTYIPEWVNGTKMENLELKDMLTHQAGLKAWIPFYLNVLKNNSPDSALFSPKDSAMFTRHVADNLWMREDYVDSMYTQISSQPLGRKEFKYSDLGYYYLMKVIEKQSKQELNHFLRTQLYEPMGLRTLGYNPLNCFDKNRIAPTENDTKFRKQVVQGYVHDPGAAMLGGVCGHAGLFGNATDLASLMQLFLNRGYYGGIQYLKPEVVDLYTTNPFKTNHRGIGFDKPKLEGGGTCSKLASSKSFGHSGFTGTLAWADPENQLNFVFLSNRVYPDQENRKIIDLGIRTDIQRVLYEAVKERKKSR